MCSDHRTVSMAPFKTKGLPRRLHLRYAVSYWWSPTDLMFRADGSSQCHQKSWEGTCHWCCHCLWELWSSDSALRTRRTSGRVTRRALQRAPWPLGPLSLRASLDTSRMQFVLFPSWTLCSSRLVIMTCHLSYAVFILGCSNIKNGRILRVATSNTLPSQKNSECNIFSST